MSATKARRENGTYKLQTPLKPRHGENRKNNKVFKDWKIVIRFFLPFFTIFLFVFFFKLKNDIHAVLYYINGIVYLCYVTYEPAVENRSNFFSISLFINVLSNRLYIMQR